MSIYMNNLLIPTITIHFINNLAVFIFLCKLFYFQLISELFEIHLELPCSLELRQHLT